jgi:AraC-like DNA-binding protein
METEGIVRLFEAHRRITRAKGSEPTPPLGELARHVGMSPSHFLRQFRTTFGETPRQLAIAARISRASELLGTTRLPITEICFECGYESLGSFSFLFRRQTGLSPREFRRRAQPSASFWPVNIQFLDRFIPFCLLDGFR